MGEMADTPYNKDLLWELRSNVADGMKFTHIYRFRKHLYWTAPDGSRSGLTPDVAGVVHHEGVVLELADTIGQPVKFLRLEMQPYGLTYFVKQAFPNIEDLIPWEESGRL